MKNLFIIICFFMLIACGKDKNAGFNVNRIISYSGYFITGTDLLVSRNVTLTIDHGTYQYGSDLPWETSAGRVNSQGNKIEFNNTLDLVIPAMYAPIFLDGTYEYVVDGDKLILIKNLNEGMIRYELEEE